MGETGTCLPWGWNTGELGPNEIANYTGANPDLSELYNGAVEPICRQYLELRYWLMPSLHCSARRLRKRFADHARLWLHYPKTERPSHVAMSTCGSRSVAPVTEKGATERPVYLPRGFGTTSGPKRVAGGREVRKPLI